MRYGTVWDPEALRASGGGGASIDLDINIPGVINLHGDNAPAQPNIFDQISTFVSMNKFLVGGCLVGAFLLMRKR